MTANPTSVEQPEEEGRRASGFVSAAAKIAEAQWPWVARALHDSIADLGYPVGMGMSPHPESTERAAKLICEYVACQVDAADPPNLQQTTPGAKHDTE